MTEPLTPASRRFRLWVLVGVLCYLTTVNQFLHVRPDHVFLALLVCSLVWLRGQAGRFLRDWLPFILFWVCYDMMRGLVDTIQPRVHIRDLYDLERVIFRPLFGETILPFQLQQFAGVHDGHWYKEVLDLLAANFYGLHFFIPLVMGWFFWHTVGDRRLFYRFTYALTVLNALALVTFMLYPAAPPWYVHLYGFARPVGPDMFGAAGSLINIDQMIGRQFFTTLWDHFNPNHFAAVPSLHAAYPLVLSVVVYQRFRRYGLLLTLYCVGVWWAAVYLNHHYVIDLIIGAAYTGVAFLCVDRFLLPRVFDPRLRWEAR